MIPQAPEQVGGWTLLAVSPNEKYHGTWDMTARRGSQVVRGSRLTDYDVERWQAEAAWRKG